MLLEDWGEERGKRLWHGGSLLVKRLVFSSWLLGWLRWLLGGLLLRWCLILLLTRRLRRTLLLWRLRWLLRLILRLLGGRRRLRCLWSWSLLLRLRGLLGRLLRGLWWCILGRGLFLWCTRGCGRRRQRLLALILHLRGSVAHGRGRLRCTLRLLWRLGRRRRLCGSVAVSCRRSLSLLSQLIMLLLEPISVLFRLSGPLLQIFLPVLERSASELLILLHFLLLCLLVFDEFLLVSLLDRLALLLLLLNISLDVRLLLLLPVLRRRRRSWLGLLGWLGWCWLLLLLLWWRWLLLWRRWLLLRWHGRLLLLLGLGWLR
mmetsp:Transcript_13073/g.17658  ORF Transcript_13073/g.17658 Transcript_13073/m.17658 type:complete len:317 (+) Transcript_13073:1501-2451(+)